MVEFGNFESLNTPPPYSYDIPKPYLSILRVSSTVRTDAKRLLLAKSMFLFVLDSPIAAAKYQSLDTEAFS